MLTLEGGCLCGAIRYLAAGTRGKPELLPLHHVPPCGGCACGDVDHHAGRGIPLHTGHAGTVRLVGNRLPRILPALRHAAPYRARGKPQEVDITSASLDDPVSAPPKGHIWTRSQIHWLCIDDGLPRHARERKPR
jgi:hypothetical protein